MFSRVRGEPDGFRFLPSKGNNNSVPPAQDRAVSGGTGKIFTAVIRHDPLYRRNRTKIGPGASGPCGPLSAFSFPYGKRETHGSNGGPEMNGKGETSEKLEGSFPVRSP